MTASYIEEAVDTLAAQNAKRFNMNWCGLIRCLELIEEEIRNGSEEWVVIHALNVAIRAADEGGQNDQTAGFILDEMALLADSMLHNATDDLTSATRARLERIRATFPDFAEDEKQEVQS
jgi:hypothetical protein